MKPDSTQKNGNQQTSKQAQTGNTSQGNEDSVSPLQKLFRDQLADIYYAEQQLLKALEEMKQAATTEELEDAFQTHRDQTQRHIQRLEKVFKSLGEEASGKKCAAIEGIIEEARQIISETKEQTMTRDAALIIAAQKAEHYEIATYGGLVQLAITLEMHRAAELLDKTLQEEEETDELLTDIAESHINMDAENESGQIQNMKKVKQ